MTTYPTRMHGPAASAPVVTNKVAHCVVCGVEWQVRSPNLDDARGCSFCGAGEDAIVVTSEGPTYGGAQIV